MKKIVSLVATFALVFSLIMPLATQSAPDGGGVDSDSCKIEGSDIGRVGATVTVDGVTITFTGWTPKEGDEGEYVGFTFVTDAPEGTVVSYVVKAGTNLFEDSSNTWINPGYESDPTVNAISNISFCGGVEYPEPEEPIDPIISLSSICAEGYGTEFTITSDMVLGEEYGYIIYRDVESIDFGYLSDLTPEGIGELYNYYIPVDPGCGQLRIEVIRILADESGELVTSYEAEDCSCVEEPEDPEEDPINVRGECVEGGNYMRFEIENVSANTVNTYYRVVIDGVRHEGHRGPITLEAGEVYEVIVTDQLCGRAVLRVGRAFLDDRPYEEDEFEGQVRAIVENCSCVEDPGEEPEVEDPEEEPEEEVVEEVEEVIETEVSEEPVVEENIIDPSPVVSELTDSGLDEVAEVEEIESEEEENSVRTNLGDGSSDSQEDPSREDSNTTLDNADGFSGDNEENTNNTATDSISGGGSEDEFVSVGTNLLAIILGSLLMTLAILGNFYFRKKVKFNN